jgi:hypothetical protein
MPIVYKPYSWYKEGKYMGEVYLSEMKLFIPKPPSPETDPLRDPLPLLAKLSMSNKLYGKVYLDNQFLGIAEVSLEMVTLAEIAFPLMGGKNADLLFRGSTGGNPATGMVDVRMPVSLSVLRDLIPVRHEQVHTDNPNYDE